MTSFAAFVASPVGNIGGRAAVRRRTVPGDVASFAASKAFHVCLAFSGIVFGITALEAGAGGEVIRIACAIATKTATRGSSAAARTSIRAGAFTSHVARLAAIVAAAGLAISWAIGLDMTELLAMVALPGISRARGRAVAGLMAWLIAVIAETLGSRTIIGVVAHVATFVAGTRRERRQPHDRYEWRMYGLTSAKPVDQTVRMPT